MEEVISVRHLRKTFRTKQKAEGLGGSLASIIAPRFVESKAINDISFGVKRGEVLGFLGPNGAGKSTTIKTLIGILFPTSGSIDVLGYVPWKERIKLSYRIGSVFGQKPQLWYHLPAIDTFNLMAKIYNVKESDYRERLKYLTEMFEIDYLNVPVRKLSLGQRMRAEIVSSLLHNPEVIFLDEPTIGLDIIAKQRIREVIQKLNKEEQVTIFLTSHDMEDVEKLCRRIIVINHGRLIFDDSMERLKKGHVLRKRIEVKFSSAPRAPRFEGATFSRTGAYSMTVELDSKKGDLSGMVSYLTRNFELLDLNVTDPPVEEIIAEIYRK